MRIGGKYLLAFCLALCFVSGIAQTEWHPTRDFPLLFSRMEKATVHYGIIQDREKLMPCNIHIGTAKKYQVLIYANENGVVMETDPDAVNKVEFPDGTYIPVEHKYFGKIIREDSIGKIVMVRDLDREKLTEYQRSTMSEASRIDLSLLGWRIPKEDIENLPMCVRFYFVYNMEIFEVTDKNILEHINQSRRKEYRAYTRAAELISTNESSVRRLWEDFFVNYDKTLKFYKKK